MLPAKRKRSQVSYAEPEDEDDSINPASVFDGRAAADAEADGDPDDDDSDYGSRKKATKIAKAKGRPAKRPKLTAEKPKKTMKTFPFLLLPQELRDEIYVLALTEPGKLTLIGKTKANRRTVARGVVRRTRGNRGNFYTTRSDDESVTTTQHNQLVPRLLAVNKQIHAEAAGYLYKQQVVFEDTAALHTFISSIGPHNRLQLSNIVLCGWGSGGIHKAMNVAAMSLLSTCTNLQSAALDCSIGWYNRPVRMAKRLYRDGHFFFESFGAAKGRKDAAVDLLQLREWDPQRDDQQGFRTVLAPELHKTEFKAEMRKLLKC